MVHLLSGISQYIFQIIVTAILYIYKVLTMYVALGITIMGYIGVFYALLGLFKSVTAAYTTISPISTILLIPTVFLLAIHFINNATDIAGYLHTIMCTSIFIEPLHGEPSISIVKLRKLQKLHDASFVEIAIQARIDEQQESSYQLAYRNATDSNNLYLAHIKGALVRQLRERGAHIEEDLLRIE